ncbi:FprA family A-type flavoprotein [Candidatus Poribacteria bacterium]|nr:FprA family A-type flavoprotein [Candidatus Poribacteria bacterium]
MKARKIKEDIYWMGAVDWDRRLFDSLIPLPDGTSYNAYLVQGSEKTVLLDTVDPSMADVLLFQLESVKNIDYIVAHHAEQDHSGTLPHVIEKYKHAKVITTPKGRGMLIDHLDIPEEKFITVDDGETLSIGNKTLEFIHTPWVHWPETMVTYLQEDYILFTCDFFGSHLATSDLYVTDEARVYEAAKRYYAEIMMPFRVIIKKNLEKIKDHKIDFIAPSHGPIYDKPKFIIDAYSDWVSDIPKNVAVLPYISMHGSTKKMVEYLVSALAAKGVTVYQFDLATTDIGKLAITLVDAATIVIGTPTVHVGPHPNVVYAAYLANALRPKLKFASIIGSYGWGGKVVEQIAGLIPNLKVEILDPVLCKGLPREADFKALDKLATTIAEKHKEL